MVEDQSDDESVVEIQIEQNQAENHDNKEPFVGQHQVVYDVEEDDDIQITFAYIKPKVPVDWRERAKKIKRERNKARPCDVINFFRRDNAT